MQWSNFAKTIGERKMQKKLVEFSRLRRRSNLTEQERLRRDELRREIAEYINGVDEPFINRVFMARYMEGKSWRCVAEVAGGANNEDSVRMMCKRYAERKTDG